MREKGQYVYRSVASGYEAHDLLKEDWSCTHDIMETLLCNDCVSAVCCEAVGEEVGSGELVHTYEGLMDRRHVAAPDMVQEATRSRFADIDLDKVTETTGARGMTFAFGDGAYAERRGTVARTEGERDEGVCDDGRGIAVAAGNNATARAILEGAGQGGLACAQGQCAVSETRGFSSLSAVRGIASGAVASGSQSVAAVSGNKARSVAYGLGSVSCLAGDGAHSHADGTYAVSAVSGDDSVSESLGRSSASVSAGNACISTSKGDGALAASAGRAALANAEGEQAVAVAAGEGARASGSGGEYAGHAVAVAVGKGVSVRGKRGTFLYAVEMSGYPVAACGYVDGHIIKENVWYVAGNDGRLHERGGEEANA